MNDKCVVLILKLERGLVWQCNGSLMKVWCAHWRLLSDGVSGFADGAYSTCPDQVDVRCQNSPFLSWLYGGVGDGVKCGV